MRTRHHLLISLATILILTSTGCDEDKDDRLAAMSQRHERRQAEQNQKAAELHREVVSLQRAVQTERAEIGRQRDQLEQARQALASERRWDSLVAAAITNIDLLLACLLLLVIAWLLLARPPTTEGDQAVVDAMLDDLTSPNPMLVHRSDESANVRRIPSVRRELTDDS